jgi:hypothetical protein
VRLIRAAAGPYCEIRYRVTATSSRDTAQLPFSKTETTPWTGQKWRLCFRKKWLQWMLDLSANPQYQIFLAGISQPVAPGHRTLQVPVLVDDLKTPNLDDA